MPGGGPHSNARSIKTRIETDDYIYRLPWLNPIRMQDPLKQGLKHSARRWGRQAGLYSNARSIKTRIETSYTVFAFSCGM